MYLLLVYESSPSPFNWWEEFCYIFLKKISSPNAFYVFFPLFKHQSSAYNVLFLHRIKKYAFLFSFQTGTGSQLEGPHNNNKATCPCCLQSRFTTHSFSYYPVYLCIKCYQTSPIYTFLSFSHRNQSI